MSPKVEALQRRMAEVNAFEAATALMDWDHQTYMPPAAGAARAAHVSILSRLLHEMLVSDETQRLAEEAAEEAATDDEKALVRIVLRRLEKSTKIPASLVEEKSRVSSEAHEVWVQARANNDFAKFRPFLETIVELNRQEAEHLGYTDHIYDALTDLYEEGATKKGWDAMFDGIRQPMVDLVARIKEAPAIDNRFLFGDWDIDAQRRFTEMIVEAIGFDMKRGRQDTAPHPFCTNFSVNDVRLTTRYQEFLGSAIFGSLHEAGHGVYEQGSPQEWDRTPLSGGVSLGVHESQSRTWENIVGRSKAFWSRYLPELKRSFPGLPDLSLDDFYRAINRVEPSFIRVEADEVTYNLHIMVRFEIECGMLDRSLEVKDLPEVWNEKYRQYLGITPPTDSLGCLQDVHWSGGMIGYFPTYSMGNILSYQIWEQLQADLGDVDRLMADGQFAPILGWLQEKVYRQGSKYPPNELIHRVCGGPLDPKPYLSGITRKYEGVYGLASAV
jgi:carboxypeptidase Taq